MLVPEPYRAERDDSIADYVSTGVKKIIGIGREISVAETTAQSSPCTLRSVSLRLAGGNSSRRCSMTSAKKLVEGALRENLRLVISGNLGLLEPQLRRRNAASWW